MEFSLQRASRRLASLSLPAFSLPARLPALGRSVLLRPSLEASRHCSTEAEAAVEKPPRDKRLNFFEVAALLPRTGVGSRLYRKTWAGGGRDPRDHHIEVTEVRLSKDDPTAEGVAYGVKCWNGTYDNFARKVTSTLNAEWRYIPEPVAVVYSRPPRASKPVRRKPNPMLPEALLHPDWPSTPHEVLHANEAKG